MALHVTWTSLGRLVAAIEAGEDSDPLYEMDHAPEGWDDDDLRFVQAAREWAGQETG